MAKHLAVATLAGFLLVLIANASAYKTIITTVQVEDGESQSCRQQVEKADLSQCQQFLSQSRREGLLVRRYHNEQDVQQCCQQIRQVDRECQCDALSFLVQEQLQRGPQPGQEQEQLQQLGRRALEIERECGLPQECVQGPSARF